MQPVTHGDIREQEPQLQAVQIVYQLHLEPVQHQEILPYSVLIHAVMELYQQLIRLQ